MSNAELFATVARAYADFRPGYPPELFEWLARVTPARDAVWDCGCGSGQASVPLAEHFALVHATDVAPEQIAAARAHARVRYSVAPAASSGLDPESVDLVTVAQALHWFDVTAFYAEAERVARRGALLAVLNYPRPQFVDVELDRCFFAFYSQVVGPYWPPERRHVEEGYRSFDFPFAEFAAPPLAIEAAWTFDALTGYVDTWSAVKAAEKVLGRAPVERFRRELAAAWGDPAMPRTLRFPLSLRVGRA